MMKAYKQHYYLELGLFLKQQNGNIQYKPKAQT